MHQSALKHTTGEAVYTDDMPLPAGLEPPSFYGVGSCIFCSDALHVVLVQSTRAHAKILSIDYTEALAVDGVLGYVDEKDIPLGGSNMVAETIVENDEQIFATEKVESSIS